MPFTKEKYTNQLKQIMTPKLVKLTLKITDNMKASQTVEHIGHVTNFTKKLGYFINKK